MSGDDHDSVSLDELKAALDKHLADPKTGPHLLKHLINMSPEVMRTAIRLARSDDEEVRLGGLQALEGIGFTLAEAESLASQPDEAIIRYVSARRGLGGGN